MIILVAASGLLLLVICVLVYCCCCKSTSSDDTEKKSAKYLQEEANSSAKVAPVTMDTTFHLPTMDTTFEKNERTGSTNSRSGWEGQFEEEEDRTTDDDDDERDTESEEEVQPDPVLNLTDLRQTIDPMMEYEVWEDSDDESPNSRPTKIDMECHENSEEWSDTESIAPNHDTETEMNPFTNDQYHSDSDTQEMAPNRDTDTEEMAPDMLPNHDTDTDEFYDSDEGEPKYGSPRAPEPRPLPLPPLLPVCSPTKLPPLQLQGKQVTLQRVLPTLPPLRKKHKHAKPLGKLVPSEPTPRVSTPTEFQSLPTPRVPSPRACAPQVLSESTPRVQVPEKFALLQTPRVVTPRAKGVFALPQLPVVGVPTNASTDAPIDLQSIQFSQFTPRVQVPHDFEAQLTPRVSTPRGPRSRPPPPPPITPPPRGAALANMRRGNSFIEGTAGSFSVSPAATMYSPQLSPPTMYSPSHDQIDIAWAQTVTPRVGMAFFDDIDTDSDDDQLRSTAV